MRSWHTVPEAAEILGFSTATVYTLLQSRKLGHYRLGPGGGRYRITEVHIAAYIKSCEVEVREPRPSSSTAKAQRSARKGDGECLDGSPARYY